MQPHNPYAPPQHQPPHQGMPYAPPPGGFFARLDGKNLVLAKTAYLPDVCVKCAAQQPIIRKRRNFVFIPWYGRFFGVIGMLITQKKATMDLPLCPACAQRAFKAVLTMWLVAGGLFALGLAMIVAGAATDTDALAVIGVLFFLSVLVVPLVLYFAWAIKHVLPQAVNIDDQTITLARIDPNAAQHILHAASQPAMQGYGQQGYPQQGYGPGGGYNQAPQGYWPPQQGG